MKMLLYHMLLVCCLASVFTPRRWVLYALGAFTPLVQTLPSPYGFLFSPPNALLLGLVALYVKQRGSEENLQPLPNRLVMILWTVVLGAGMIRTWVFPPQIFGERFDALEVFLNCWYWSTPFLVFWLVFRLVDSRDEARKILLLCFLSASGEAFLAMYERLQGIGRATAHLDEPNRAGAYFAGTTVLFFAFVLLEKGRARLFYIAVWLMAAGALLATLSRGGMLAASTGALVVFLLFLAFSPDKGTATKFNYVILGILLVANIALIVPQRVVDRIMVTVEGDPRENVDSIDPENMDSSAQDRLALWTVGLLLFEEQPSGYGAFTATPLQARYRGNAKAMHNIYLQVLVEHGVQGLLVLLILILSVGKNLYKGFRRVEDVEERAALLGLFGYWIALCVAHFFVNPFFMLHLTGQFWVMSACALRLRIAAAEEAPAVGEAAGPVAPPLRLRRSAGARS